MSTALSQARARKLAFTRTTSISTAGYLGGGIAGGRVGSRPAWWDDRKLGNRGRFTAGRNMTFRRQRVQWS